ncbi:MAG: TRAP transporter small permease subunit [Lachnospiraceae bacterium]|nr:TRAP transporter small permease subunit [Lachnospiraceae bacterium]
MAVYKKIMHVVTVIEKIVLALALCFVLALTFGNVVARKVFQHSWGFTEEIVVALFVLLSLLAAGVAAQKAELVNLSLVTEFASLRTKKIFKVIETVFCVAYSLILAVQGLDRMRVDHTQSPILHIPTTVFWSFVLIGGISMALHFVENCIIYCLETKEEAK